MKYIIKSALVVFLMLFGSVHMSVIHATDCVTPGCDNAFNNKSNSRINYTILNDTGQLVKFKLPSGKTYKLKPGQRGEYNNRVQTNKPKIHIYNSNRTYSLRSGNFKFGWNKSRKQIEMYTN